MTVRPHDYGDRYPSDVGDTAPADPTAGFAEVDYIPRFVGGRNIEKPVATPTTIPVGPSTPNIPASKPAVYLGVIVSSRVETYYYWVLTQDGRRVLGYTLTSGTLEIGTEVTVIRGNSSNSFFIVPVTPPTPLIFRGKPSAEIAAGADGTMVIHTSAGATTKTVAVTNPHNRAMKTTLYCYARKVDGWDKYVISADHYKEC